MLTKSRDVKSPSRNSRNTSSLNSSYYRVLEQECKNFKVKLNKPKNVKSFMDALEIIVKERKKAENVLLDEVETDIENKERFISEQVKTLKEMFDNRNKLIEHKCVLQVFAEVYKKTMGLKSEEEE